MQVNYHKSTLFSIFESMMQFSYIVDVLIGNLCCKTEYERFLSLYTDLVFYINGKLFGGEKGIGSLLSAPTAQILPDFRTKKMSGSIMHSTTSATVSQPH